MSLHSLTAPFAIFPAMNSKWGHLPSGEDGMSLEDQRHGPSRLFPSGPSSQTRNFSAHTLLALDKSATEAIRTAPVILSLALAHLSGAGTIKERDVH